MKNQYDIIIVGGGAAGSSLAFGLGGKGRKVLLLEAVTRTNLATRANVGLVWCQSKILGWPYIRWAHWSSSFFPQVLQELKELTGLTVRVFLDGGIAPTLSEKEYQDKLAFLEQLKQHIENYNGKMISRSEMEELIPNATFGPDVCGGLWGAADGMIDPLALNRVYHAAMPARGVELKRDTIVYEIIPEAGGFRLSTSSGEYSCERVVLAAGLANLRLAQFALPDLPIFADKGQVMVTERLPFIGPTPILGCTQTFDGTFIIGFRHERIGHDLKIYPNPLGYEADLAMRIFPRLADKRIVRSWTALRIMPEDHQPIFSSLPGHPKAFVINTHNAISLSAAICRLLPDFVLGGTLPDSGGDLTLKRFGFEC